MGLFRRKKKSALNMGLFRRKKKSALNRVYGWRPEPAGRPKVISKLHLTVPGYGPITDLRAGCPPVYDQTTLGSCTANALSGGYDYEHFKQFGVYVTPSRLFIYFNERYMEGTVDQDAGAIISDGVKVINTQGVCPESMWPYDVSQFTTKPPQACYDAASKELAVQNLSVNPDANTICGTLAAGYPIVFGFNVRNSFESQAVASNGVYYPGCFDGSVGGHAVLAVGYTYDITKVHSQGTSVVLPPGARSVTQWLIVRNSWGAGWGDKGYFYMPMATVLKDGSDFWALQQVT